MTEVRGRIWVVVATLALAGLMALPALGNAKAQTAGATATSGANTPNTPRLVDHAASARSQLLHANYLGTTSLGGAASAAGSRATGAIAVSGKEFSRPEATGPAASTPAQVPGAAVAAGGGALSAKGLNAFNSGQSNLLAPGAPLDIEPPDQGLCAGGGYVLEAVNLVVQVYTPSLQPVPGTMTSLAGLLGFPVAQQFGASGTGGGYILSDPRCLYDAGTGHWFLTFLYLGGAGVYSNSGDFPLGPSTYGAEFVLASTGTAPTSFNVYDINVTSDPLTTNCPCFGDQPLLGADANTLLVSTNEFPVFQNGFNGAQVYLFDKAALAAGSASVNVAHFNIGQTVNPPDGNCASSGGLFCFYSVLPTIAPTTGSWDSSHGGTAWAVSSLDFFGSGDNRLAVWAFSNTSAITSSPASIALTLYLLGGLETYASVGQLVPQESGPIPLGSVKQFGLAFTGAGGGGCAKQCKTGPLASNGDGTQGSAAYAQGAIWVGVSSEVTVAKKTTMGVAFWVVNAAGTSVSLATQGYIAVPTANLIFPAFAVGPTGNALVTFTLTGPSNFPSTAFAWVSPTGTGAVGNTVYISAAGQSPTDGFSEYQNIQNNFYRPRWGDYSYSIWAGGTIYFASEYIQYANCGSGVFLKDPTCGGTRDPFANWGTSLNSVSD